MQKEAAIEQTPILQRTVPAIKKETKEEQSSSAVKIERMKFPQFNGDRRRYPQFREEFVKHIQPQCQKEQLAFVLKNYLTTEVREEVGNCGEEYENVFERLDERYGNTGQLIDAMLYEVNILPYGRSDARVTLQMIKIVDKAYRDLQRLKAEEEMCNSTVISIIEQRMPILMKQEWVKKVASTSMSSKQRFRLLIELLQDWRCRLEYMGDSMRAVPELRGRVLHTDNEQENSNQSRRQKCWLHQIEGVSGEHPIWRFREFLGKTVKDRIKLVRECKACVVCLLTTSTGTDGPDKCRSRFKCREPGCGRNHNRLLHKKSNTVPGSIAHASG